MPGFDPILIGATENDGTGTPHRECWVKVNAQLGELFGALAAKADNAAVQNAIVSLTDSIGSLAQNVAGKASSETVGGKADSNTVPRFDTNQTITKAQKLQLATNMGQLVTLVFQLLDDESQITTGSWDLPKFPDNFYLHSVVAVVAVSMRGQFTCVLKDDTDSILASAVNANLANSGAGEAVNLNLVLQDVVALRGLTVTAHDVIVDYDAMPAQGLTLWVRGVWVP